MNVYEVLGFGWIVFSAGIGTALAMICAGVGATLIYRTYKQGAKDPLERLIGTER